ncbi:MAG: LPS export ABC transporter periplasmic protein LptC, partial [Dokdonella sp.]
MAMLDRRFVFILVALSALAALSQILLWLARPPTVEPDFIGPPRSGYTLDTFTLNALDEAGKLNLTISGPRLVRRGEDGSIFVTTPDYVMMDSEGHPWVGTSASAWVNKDGSQMQLEGDVVLRRKPSSDVTEATITTSNLTAWP